MDDDTTVAKLIEILSVYPSDFIVRCHDYNGTIVVFYPDGCPHDEVYI